MQETVSLAQSKTKAFVFGQALRGVNGVIGALGVMSVIGQKELDGIEEIQNGFKNKGDVCVWYSTRGHQDGAGYP